MDVAGRDTSVGRQGREEITRSARGAKAAAKRLAFCDGATAEPLAKDAIL